MRTLGDIIKQYRKDHGLTQRDFAKLSTMSSGYISMLENNDFFNKFPSPNGVKLVKPLPLKHSHSAAQFDGLRRH